MIASRDDASDRSHDNAPPADDWSQHAGWALALVHSLTADSARHPRERVERLLAALAQRFRCAAVDSSDSTSSASAMTYIDRLTLGDGRHVAITLTRPADATPFTVLEQRWISMVHAGCAWAYAPADEGGTRRFVHLSPREREALGHLLRGASEKEVAASLGRSRHTVHSYVKRIYRTLGVRSRSELRSVFRDHGGEPGNAPGDASGDVLTASGD